MIFPPTKPCAPRATFASRIVAAAVLASPGFAFAQTPPPRTPSPPTSPSDATAVGEIVVTGQRSAATTSIDRRTYRVDSDLQAASGSVSDVLKNIPSVEVDAQGVVSLRGDPSVQILIDGRPSTTMSALNRADTLQGLSANSIETIEVITNPSAAFRPDGTAGIINIVTKKTRAQGMSGSVRASVGTDGRYSLGVSATRRIGALTLNGNLGLRQDERIRRSTDDRVLTDPITGVATETRQVTAFDTSRLSKTIGAGLEYDATPRDRLSAGASYTERSGDLSAFQTNQVLMPGGSVTRDYDRLGGGDETQTSDELLAGWRHTFSGEGRTFSLDLRRGRTVEQQTRQLTNRNRLPAGPDQIDLETPSESELQRQLTAVYATPLAGGDLEVGYDVLREDANYRHRGGAIDAGGVYLPDANRTNRFLYDRTIHALYATWDRPLTGKLSAIFGLRLEEMIDHADQVDLAQTRRRDAFDVYPTLHLQYELSDTQTLRLSYSKRVARPEVEDLNPYPTYTDPLNLRAGNPDLKPRETDSFEASYQYAANGTSWEVTGYLRKTTDTFTEVTRLISPTIVLTTEENLGRSDAAGLVFAGRGKLTDRITYRVSGDVNYTRLDPGNLGFEVRSGWNSSAKGGLDYQLTPSDLLQLSVDYRGRRQTAQGYREGVASANLGYLHTFANGVSAVATVSDVFDSQIERSHIDTATLQQITERRGSRRLFNFAVTIPFGGARPARIAPAELTD